MSWKLFWQIVLLIVIAAIVISTFNYGMLHYRYKCKGQFFQNYPHKTLQK